MPSSPKKQKRAERDLYPTPFPVIDGLCRVLPKGICDTVVDIGCGPDCRIAKSILDAGCVTKAVCIDIDQNSIVNNTFNNSRTNFICEDALSFLKYYTIYPDNNTIIATNPPFSIAFEIVQMSIKIIRSTSAYAIFAMLMPLGFLGSKKRSSWWPDNTPNDMHIINPRPSFRGKGSDSETYCWALWNNYESEPGKTHLHWLNCENRK